MAERPVVSVVLPMRDAQKTIADCLQSILAQTFPLFETIIIDDGSKDDSAAIVAAWAKRDNRIRLIKQPPQGIVAALNHGLALARGRYIARMDADDLMQPQRLQAQTQFLYKNADIGLLASQVEVFPRHESNLGLHQYVDWQNSCVSAADIKDEIYIESPLVHPSVMMRREIMPPSGLYRDGDFPEDYELWLRLTHAGVKMAKTPQVLLRWRDSDTRATRIDKRYQRQNFDALRARYLSQDRRLLAERPLVIWGAGRKTRKRVGLLFEYGFKPHAWIDIDTKKIGKQYHQATVFASGWLHRHATKTPHDGRKPFVLGYVNNYGARELIAQVLNDFGYIRGKDYLMVG